SIEPYSAAPFSRAPISEPGGETVSSSVLSLAGNNAIVDWVLLELRSALNPATIVANKRALIQRDGDIVSAVDGLSPVFFKNTLAGNYFVSVKHRNHLGVMSENPLLLSDCPVAIQDFTIGNVYTNPMISNAPRKQVGAIYTLWPADNNYNKNVKYNGLNSDKDMVLTSLGGPAFLNATLHNVYRAEDGNMDGKVRFNNTDNDRALILMTVGVNTPNSIISQHTPN
ncbi:MAG TPA: hypothetical protein PLU17_13630, partial [Chitinophagaceae bacterium]|nr:hypothetical protein [Chitinophagaceae bacterium]